MTERDVSRDVLGRDEDVRVAFTEDLTVSTDATVVRIPADAGFTSSMSHCGKVEIMSTVTLYLPFHILVVFGIWVERFVTPLFI